MPAKVLPSVEAFEKFRRALLRRGFMELLPTEFKQDWWRLRLVAPSHREGREVGFSFAANGLEVRVWTTYLAGECAREKDAGWVLIKDGDEAKYFTHPIHRTEGFLHTLLGYASVARQRILNRPLCPVCDTRMKIVRGKGLKARYWQCVRPLFHDQPVSLPWDHGLPQAALDFLHPRRRARVRYRTKLRMKGKKPGAALRRRRGWRVGRPENLLSLK